MAAGASAGTGCVREFAEHGRTDRMTSMEKRVCFDFEIEFSNGGGIQGQGFRLDIEGDDIDDDALAEYIVRDMRLLMVGAVRILNKRIIEEPHKRPLEAGSGTASDQ